MRKQSTYLANLGALCMLIGVIAGFASVIVTAVSGWRSGLAELLCSLTMMLLAMEAYTRIGRQQWRGLEEETEE